jgi:hypothetical protein
MLQQLIFPSVELNSFSVFLHACYNNVTADDKNYQSQIFRENVFHVIFWSHKDFQRTGQYFGLDSGKRAAIGRYTYTCRSAIGHCTVKSRVDWTKTRHVTFWRLTDVTLSWLEVDSHLERIQLY